MTATTASPGLILDVLDVLERHGYTRGDNQHTGRAIGLIRDLARIYEGTQDHPTDPPSPRRHRRRHRQPGPEPNPDRPSPRRRTPSPSPTPRSGPSWPRWTSPPTDKRDRAEMCADCADQSCPACQSRLRDAEAYDQMADQMLQAASKPPGPLTAGRAPGHPASPGPPPTRRPASDHTRQGTRTNPDTSRQADVPPRP